MTTEQKSCALCGAPRAESAMLWIYPPQYDAPARPICASCVEAVRHAMQRHRKSESSKRAKAKRREGEQLPL